MADITHSGLVFLFLFYVSCLKTEVILNHSRNLGGGKKTQNTQQPSQEYRQEKLLYFVGAHL